MPTEASLRALEGMRDMSTLQWYVIPLLAIVFYIYALEVRRARKTSNWNAVFAGLTIFGMDFINETWNGWVFHLTQHSALWTAPGPTALRTMMGWNTEIMFMFAISGIIYHHSLTERYDAKILGMPERWFWAVGYSVFCVFIECFLNLGGHLVWEYSFWNRSFGGVWLIFLIGYLHFYVAAGLVIGMKTNRAKIITVACLFGVAIGMNVIAMGFLGWNY
jgi:hypothetical protein